MKGEIFAVIGTPHSNCHSILAEVFTNEKTSEMPVFLANFKTDSKNIHQFSWNLINGRFEFQIREFPLYSEWYLFFSQNEEISSQIEGLIDLLDHNQELSLARIITFVDSDLLEQEPFFTWLDCAAHFSDAMCFCNRSNDNAKFIKNAIERYKLMHYPIETLIHGNKKKSSINRLLSNTTLRISHVFDSPELLENDDSPESDPYLKRHNDGRRVRAVPYKFQQN